MFARVAALFALACALASAQNRPVRLKVTVTRGDDFVADLPASAFTLLENGKPQTIQSVEHAAGPASWCFVVDSSGSTADKVFRIRRISLALLNAISPQDEICVILFNADAYLITKLTMDRNEIQRGIATTNPHGRTAIRDACVLAAQYLAQTAKNEKKVVVVISDGIANAGKIQFDAFKTTLLKTNAVVYALALADQRVWARADPPPGEVLAELTDAYGGVAYQSTEAVELQRAGERIANDVRGQYLLTYSPLNQTLDQKVSLDQGEGGRQRIARADAVWLLRDAGWLQVDTLPL